MIPAASAAAAISSVFFICSVCVLLLLLLFTVCANNFAEGQAGVNFYLNYFEHILATPQKPNRQGAGNAKSL